MTEKDAGKLSSCENRVIPSGQDGSILTARVANHSTGFASSCPPIEPATKAYCISNIIIMLRARVLHNYPDPTRKAIEYNSHAS